MNNEHRNNIMRSLISFMIVNINREEKE